MSLLWMDCDADFERLIDVACEYEVRARGDYFDKKGEETRKIFSRTIAAKDGRSISLDFEQEEGTK